MSNFKLQMLNQCQIINVKAKIESLLLVAGKPVEFKKLAKILGTDKKIVQQTIVRLKQEYQAKERGFRIVSNGISAELATAPENAKVVAKMISFEKAIVSQAKMETLAVLAYQGPLTKAELENIRGVNCSLILKNLKIDDLIDETLLKGALKYQVSIKFLKMLGVTAVEELPDYDTLKIKS
jgi:segregation and condensation protein B